MLELSFPECGSPELDRPCREWLPEADVLVDAAADQIAGGQPDRLVELFGEMGAPVLDSTVTPLSARAALLGLQNGRSFHHHELRRRIPMPEPLEPEKSVWDAGTVPTWRDGVLEEPKYFSFFQDAPFPACNPNCRRKWRPHELIHGALGFFWHPEMTRFEFYVGARLNELLPVVHWYGLDEMFRPSCEEHRDELLYQDYCSDCERRAHHYWEASDEWIDERRTAALRWAEQALDHFETEWEACLAEIDTGKRHPTPRPHLDSSSDSVGYLHGHWNRVTDWTFGVWLETFLEDGVDYVSSLSGYARRLADTANQLMSGTISIEPDDFHKQRNRRTIQDVAYRIYLAMGWLGDDTDKLDRVETLLMPHLEQAAHHVHHMDEGERVASYSEDVVIDLLDAFDEVRDCFPEEIAELVPALGYTFCERERFVTAARPQLEEGLENALPRTFDTIEETGDAAEAFALSDAFESHGRFATRFAEWAQDSSLDDGVTELARLEAWATDGPRKDEEAELFGALPANVDEFIARPARLRLNETFRRDAFDRQTASTILDDDVLPPERDEIELVSIFMRGDLRMMPIDEGAAEIIEAVKREKPRSAWVEDCALDSLWSLLQNGFLVWLPRPA